VLALAMAKVREERFGTAAELAEAFVAACAGKLDANVQQRAEWLVAQNPWADEMVGPSSARAEEPTAEA
jgi:hypothetical protein